jgi:hypothetical protein
MPPSAEETTPCETPVATASAEMLETKELKSPPQCAASAGRPPPSAIADNSSAPNQTRPFILLKSPRPLCH